MLDQNIKLNITAIFIIDQIKEIIETVFGKLEEGKEFTDESGMLEESLGKIKAHLGAADNIKITHPEDLNLVKSILIAQGRIFL